mmetsp:Transcript_25469/g.39132  ORF Transcript_25469/g.39132 Transcript_25469/m.39132 type:complete len:714 (+) Transcript_25469:73-2214(+)
MARSKKKKGGRSNKQRRRKDDDSAQEQQQSSQRRNQETRFDSPNPISVAIYGGSLMSLSPTNVVEAVQKREEVPTAAVQLLLHENSKAVMNLPQQREEFFDVDITVVIQRLIDADLISTLIDLVTANDCMLEEGGSEEVGGKPLCFWWLSMLNSFCVDETYSWVRPRIASSIAPLVRCMQDDCTREYFRSNMKWHASMFVFIALIHELSKTKEALDVLLQYEGFSEFMIHCMLWGEYRPDIINEAESYSYPDIKGNVAFGFLGRLLKHYADSPEEGRKKVLEIATMPSVNRAYDPNCSTPFIHGLVQCIQNSIMSKKDDKGELFYILRHFTMVDCLDKNVIASIVKVGTHNALDHSDASNIVEVCLHMVASSPNAWLTWSTGYLDDKRFSFAIDAGLFEMFLVLLERFEERSGDEEDRLTKAISSIMNAANKARFFKRTAKSIFKRSERILDALGTSSIPDDNANCKQITRMMKSILDAKQAPDERRDIKWPCKHCLRMLTKEDIRRCGKCNETIYCSRECQVSDWHNHKKECDPSPEKGTKVMNVVSSYDQNASLHVQNLFRQNEYGFARQAVLIQHDITDCVCSIDIRNSPPVLKVMPISEFLALNPEDNIRDAISRGRDSYKEVISVGTTYCEKNGDVGVLVFNLGSARPGEYAAIQDQMKGMLEIQSSRENVDEVWDKFAECIWKLRWQGVGDRIDVEWDNSNVTYWDE